MKIKRLEFKAFGPFTGRELDFASALPGLHIVHGPNEAGKSSAMRGLHALFFGFPPRTADNFLHPYDQLLVGGCLQQAEGGELCFYRRKKSKNDLFDAQDQPLAAETLTPFLQGLGQDLFSSMYGINHETLVQGGQGILDQQGEVGQALFAAGAGFASLKAVIDGLEGEGDELFRPRATSKAISQALSHYKELQGQMRLVSLGSQEWTKHRLALAQAEDELRCLAARRQQLDREIHQLERLRQALPFLGERRRLTDKLQVMGEVVVLPEDFASRRRQLEENRRTVRVRLDGAEGRLAGLREKQVAISLNRAVLDHAEDIENVHQRLGAYRKGLEDRPRLEGQRIACKTEAARLLRRIRPDLDVEQAETLRPGLAKRKTVQTLGQRHEAVLQGVRQAEAQTRELRRELAARQAQLAALGRAVEGTSLLQALNVARKAGDLDEDLRTRQGELLRTRSICEAALQRLGLWNGTVEEVGTACMPSPETVNEFEAALQQVDEELRRQVLDEEKISQGLFALTRDVRAIEHIAVVPSEAELASCRTRREQGWHLLRRRWIDGEDVESASRLYAPDLPLPEAYEQCVVVADQTADRLYREADRVQKHAQLLAGIESAEASLHESRGRIAAAGKAREEIGVRWQGLWAGCGIVPRGPREMRAWLATFDALRLQVEELGRIDADVRIKKARQHEMRTLLMQELALAGVATAPDDAGLGPVLRRAEAVAEALREDKARREALARNISDLASAVDKADAGSQDASTNLAEWREAWEEALVFLGLPGRALPAEAADYVDTVQECLAKLDEEDVLRKRRDGIDRDGRSFETSVRDLAERVAPGEVGLDAALTVGRLKGLLAQAVREQTVLLRHEEDSAVLRKDIAALREELGLVEEELTALRALARCANDEGMIEAELRFAAWVDVRRNLDEVESTLVRIAEGGTVEDLEALAGEQDADALPGAISALRAELAERVEPEIRRLAEQIGQEKNELSRMNGDDTAARLAEEMQEVLARITRMTGRYIRVKLASRVLRAEIERYRAANQDPLLGIASGVFQDLTLGSFAGLRADIDEGDKPVLVGLRPSGGWVKVEGMSSGTRDQLYLALRLASLRQRSRTMEAMPFIVDDILINFDEKRCEATLKVFADMADRNQVIMFTHQAQIANMARSLKREDRVFVHSL